MVVEEGSEPLRIPNFCLHFCHSVTRISLRFVKTKGPSPLSGRPVSMWNLRWWSGLVSGVQKCVRSRKSFLYRWNPLPDLRLNICTTVQSSLGSDVESFSGVYHHLS